MNEPKNKFLNEEKRAELPNKELAEFYKTLEGKVLKHIISCLDNGNLFEAYLFLWALVEQELLPKLIIFISQKININIPKSFDGFNQAAKNTFYLGLSHDKELFEYLESGRKERNSIIHKLIEKQSKGTKDQAVKNAFKNAFHALDEIFVRLTGKTPVPVLTLYASGWNDCIKQFKKNAKDKFGFEI